MTVGALTRLDDVVAVAARQADAATPAEVAAARRVTADVVAAAFAGARRAEHAALIARVSEPIVEEVSPNVAGDVPRRAQPMVAALLNATSAVALELDESVAGGGHPGVHVVPAALAVAQDRGATGGALLHAVRVGYEVAARLHRLRRPRFPSHPHGAIGAIGAAAAVAALRDEPPLPAARAAATLPLLPTWSACFEGAAARDAWPGVGALVGVLAADLAASGLHGSDVAPFEALDRAFDAADGVTDDEALILRSVQRRLPVAGPLQTAVEAARELRAAGVEGAEGAAGPIERVVVATVEGNRKFDRLPAPNDLSARFSLPYAVACALADDVPDFAFRPELLPLARRVEVVVAPDLQAAWPGTIGARVTVVRDGAEQVAERRRPDGHPDRPLSEDDARERERTLLGVRGDVAERLADLAELPSVTGLLEVTA